MKKKLFDKNKKIVYHIEKSIKYWGYFDDKCSGYKKRNGLQIRR